MSLSGGAVLPDGRMILIPRAGYAEGGSVVAKGGSVMDNGGPRPRFRDPNTGEEIQCHVPRPVEPGGACRRVTFMQLDGDKCYTIPPWGINFIFVQGKESACVITCDMDRDQDRKAIFNDLNLQFGLLADRKHFRVNCAQIPVVLEPRAVVNVLCNGDNLNEENGSMCSSDHKVVEYVDEQAAIGLLKGSLKNGSTDTFIGTIQVAISALQCMYMKNLEANEIEVLAVDAHGTRTLLAREDIARHLAVINYSSG